MRDSCLECVLKHLAQAAVLMTEAELGYPSHAALAIGHMAEAESEALLELPDLAFEIRGLRLKYIGGERLSIMPLIEKVYLKWRQI